MPFYYDGNTTPEDVKALLKRVGNGGYASSAFAKAQCQLQFDVSNASGTKQTKFVPMDPCLPLAKWVDVH